MDNKTPLCCCGCGDSSGYNHYQAHEGSVYWFVARSHIARWWRHHHSNPERELRLEKSVNGTHVVPP